VTPGSAAVLEVRGVTKGFTTPAGTTTVLDGVDLDVRGGEIVAVAGRSGSGKTVLLTIAAGWEAPDAGTVTVASSAAPPAWDDVALLPQSLGLLDELTVEENLALPHRLARRASEAPPPDLTERLGIAHLADRYPSQISLGEQQRVALARAAVVSPRLLVADEPLAHQNQGWGEAMLALLADLAAAGTACLVASHDPLALRAAHRTLDLADTHLLPR
jgi:putative ABC transport system ATP-binding protein